MDKFGTWKSRTLACTMVTGGSGLVLRLNRMVIKRYYRKNYCENSAI